MNYQPVMATQYNIANLIEDFTYEFRVIAVNDAGESKPSAVSSRVVVKDPKGWYYNVLHYTKEVIMSLK